MSGNTNSDPDRTDTGAQGQTELSEPTPAGGTPRWLCSEPGCQRLAVVSVQDEDAPDGTAHGLCPEHEPDYLKYSPAWAEDALRAENAALTALSEPTPAGGADAEELAALDHAYQTHCTDCYMGTLEWCEGGIAPNGQRCATTDAERAAYFRAVADRLLQQRDAADTENRALTARLVAVEREREALHQWVHAHLLPAWRSLDSEPMNGPMHTAMQALAALLDVEPPDGR